MKKIKLCLGVLMSLALIFTVLFDGEKVIAKKGYSHKTELRIAPIEYVGKSKDGYYMFNDYTVDTELFEQYFVLSEKDFNKIFVGKGKMKKHDNLIAVFDKNIYAKKIYQSKELTVKKEGKKYLKYNYNTGKKEKLKLSKKNMFYVKKSMNKYKNDKFGYFLISKNGKVLSFLDVSLYH